jgi:hypothetical protein
MTPVIPTTQTYIATTASIGGSALAANACASGTVTVPGLVTGQNVSIDVRPLTDPNAAGTISYTWYGYISAANTVTVKECAVAAGTPAATTFRVSVAP